MLVRRPALPIDSLSRRRRRRRRSWRRRFGWLVDRRRGGEGEDVAAEGGGGRGGPVAAHEERPRGAPGLGVRPAAGDPDELAAVEAARRGFAARRHELKHSSDLLMRMQVKCLSPRRHPLAPTTVLYTTPFA